MLVYLCREVLIVARGCNYYLLRFLGFSMTSPYVIVTEFVPRGSPYDAIRHQANSPSLTANDKLLISLGIARGMISSP